MTEQTETLEQVLQVGGDPADLPFWNACAEGRFLLHRCGHCKRHYWPASRCVEHCDADMAWVDASGEATLYTYTIMHRAYTRDTQDKVPFVVGVVQLKEGPFFHSNIVNCDQAVIEIGMALRVVMADHAGGLRIPMFEPV